jgi:hypothetical protein
MDFSMFGLMFLLVPLLIGAVALAMAFGAVRDLLRGSRLARSGQQAEGRVVAAQMHHSGSRDNRSSRLVETIEFTTDRGQTVRANPSVNDAGSVDRTGMSVAVLYDRDRPELFIAPRNGRSISPTGPLTRIGFTVVMLAFLTFFVGMSQGMLRLFPF